jgi:hypothetical protein
MGVAYTVFIVVAIKHDTKENLHSHVSHLGRHSIVYYYGINANDGDWKGIRGTTI